SASSSRSAVETGSTAMLMTGSGNVIAPSTIGGSGAASVSPVRGKRGPEAPTISPQTAPSRGPRSCAWGGESCGRGARLVARDVQDLRRAVDPARVDPEIRDVGVLVRLGLERVGAEGRLRVGLALAVGPVLGDELAGLAHGLALRARHLALDRREVDRRGEV